jgi:hypothetical protein
MGKDVRKGKGVEMLDINYECLMKKGKSANVSIIDGSKIAG